MQDNGDAGQSLDAQGFIDAYDYVQVCMQCDCVGWMNEYAEWW